MCTGVCMVESVNRVHQCDDDPSSHSHYWIAFGIGGVAESISIDDKPKYEHNPYLKPVSCDKRCTVSCLCTDHTPAPPTVPFLLRG